MALALEGVGRAAETFPAAIGDHRASVMPDSTLARLAMVAGVRENVPVGELGLPANQENQVRR